MQITKISNHSESYSYSAGYYNAKGRNCIELFVKSIIRRQHCRYENLKQILRKATNDVFRAGYKIEYCKSVLCDVIPSFKQRTFDMITKKWINYRKAELNPVYKFLFKNG